MNDNIIKSFLDMVFSLLSFAPIAIVFFVIISIFSSKKLPKTDENKSKLPPTDIERLLLEIRNNINNAQNKNNKVLLDYNETQNSEIKNYEIQSYETQSSEIRSYETQSSEIQSYETQSSEIQSYEDLYKQPKKKKKKKTSANFTPEREVYQKRTIEQKQRNSTFVDKNDMRKAFLMAELLKPKYF